MKKEAVKNQKKEVKPVVNVKRKPGKQVTLKKAGTAAVKKLAVGTELPPKQQSVDSAIVPLSSEADVLKVSTEQVEVAAVEPPGITGQPLKPQTTDTATITIIKESKVLRERLGLSGYITETVKILTPIGILGCKAEGVVFAKQIEGIPVDRILLHVALVSATGKRSIVSSRKKLSSEEWQALTDVLSSQAITWRDKELKRAAK
jgi:hypothetical protein